MRRFFAQKFREMFTEQFEGKEAKSKWYYEYIKKFTAELFGAENSNLSIL